MDDEIRFAHDLELADVEQNKQRILWLAAGDIWEHRDD